MSELDDLLSKDRASRDASATLHAFTQDHGKGWRVSAVSEPLTAFIDDFIARLSPNAGVEGYWVDRLGEPTVHLPPERIGFLSGYTSHHKAHLRNRARMMRAESKGPARVLLLSFERNDSGATHFDFLNVGGGWRPAHEIAGGFNAWDSPWYTEDAKQAMVAYLRS